MFGAHLIATEGDVLARIVFDKLQVFERVAHELE